MNMYEYAATIKRWVDADTADVSVDLGFTVHVDIRIRLMGIDAPERYTDAGKAASAYVKNEWPTGASVLLVSHGRGKYGRWLGELFFEADNQPYSINDVIVASGHADLYTG